MPTNWAERPLEQLLRKELKKLSGTDGDDLLADYATARKKVIEDIAEHIGKADPDLTDHGPRHLADVMDRAFQLLQVGPQDLSPLEFYILCVSILFHDVGNLHGRKDHQKKVGRIYHFVRGNESRFAGERNSVIAIAGAHTGATKDGDKDTLKPLNLHNFQGKPVRVRELAAILRLADELAEGPHRTSAYLSNNGMYALGSAKFHAYADSAEYAIQKTTPARIAITCTILIKKSENGFEAYGVPLKELLALCYTRIVKLDQERRFCKYYCPFLLPLAETIAVFRFYFDGQELETNLQPLVLSDLVVPGDPSKTVVEVDAAYDLGMLIPTLLAQCVEV